MAAERKIWSQDGEIIIYEDQVKELVRRGSLNAGYQTGYAAKPVPPLTNLVIADSGFGCVKLIVAGAKVDLAYICSIKQAHANFSKDYIKEHFKDAPSGQRLTNSLPGHALPPRTTRTAPRARDDDDAGEAEALPLHRRHSPRPYGKKNEQPDFDPAKSQGGRRAGPGRSAGESKKAYKKRYGICARDKASFPSGVKTSFYCGHELCGRAVPLCRDGSGHHSRSCFEVHISECAGRGVGLQNKSARRETI